MRIKVLVCVASLAIPSLSPSAAVAQDAPKVRAQEDITVSGRKAEDKNRRVCKRTISTGSIMPKTTCRTAGEWEAQAARSMRTLEMLRDQQEAEENIRRAREMRGS